MTDKPRYLVIVLGLILCSTMAVAAKNQGRVPPGPSKEGITLPCEIEPKGTERYKYTKQLSQRCTATGWEAADNLEADTSYCIAAHLMTYEYYPRSSHHYYYDWKEVLMRPGGKSIQQFALPGDTGAYNAQLGHEYFTNDFVDLQIGSRNQYPDGYSKSWTTSTRSQEVCYSDRDGFYRCQNYGKPANTVTHEAYCDNGTWHYVVNGTELTPLN